MINQHKTIALVNYTPEENLGYNFNYLDYLYMI